jgi:AcrR family transcriptional regulator
MTEAKVNGRPRDLRIDQAVLQATRDLLADGDYSNLTVTAVAARAGTSTNAIYRRWPSKVLLVHEAIFVQSETFPIPDSGDLRADLRGLVGALVATFSDPAIRAALPGLLMEIMGDPDLHDVLLARFREPVWDVLRTRLDSAIEAGQARAGVDPNLLLEALAGTVFFSFVLRMEATLDDEWMDRCVDLLVQGVAP